MKLSIVVKAPLARGIRAAAVLAAVLLGPLSWGAPGDLDPAFGDLGRVGPLTGLPGPAYTLELQDDGFLLAGGHIGPVDGDDTSLLASGFAGRSLASGAPDPAFSAPALAGIQVRDLARQPDGKIVGVGNSVQEQRSSLTVFRLEPNGALDPAFGDAGVVRYAPEGSSYVASSVVLDPDGRIVVAGVRDGQPIVLALAADGSVDTAFGDGGLFTVGLRLSFSRLQILRTASGAYRIATAYRPDPESPRALACSVLGVTAGGTLDPDFGGDGMVVVVSTTPLNSFVACGPLAEQADGSLLVAGRDKGRGFAIRLFADGARDPGFSTAAVAERMTNATALAVAGDGSTLVAGENGDVADAVIVRLQPSGALDTQFGNAGVTWVDLAGEFPSQLTVHDIEQLPDGGALLVGGDFRDDATTPFVARLIGNDGRASPGVVGIVRSSPVVAENAGLATVTVRRTGGTSGAISVSYSSVSDEADSMPASAGEDYTAVQGQLQWAEGDASEQQIVVPIAADGVAEPAERFHVLLANPQGGASLGSHSAAVEIGNPNGLLELEISEAVVAEGAALTVTVYRLDPAVGDVSVELTTTPGTAGIGDFDPNPITISWADGDTTPYTVTVAITDDAEVEPVESFTVALAQPTGGATLGSKSSGSITINDNDVSSPSGNDPPSPSGGGGSGGWSLLLLAAIALARKLRGRRDCTASSRTTQEKSMYIEKSAYKKSPFRSMAQGLGRHNNHKGATGMSKFQLTRISLAAALLGLVITSPRVEAQNAEIVIEWNQALQATLPATTGLFGPRYYSMMHVAMFDAVNSIEGAHSPYRVKVDAPIGASTDAAAAQAARDVLVGLIPTAQTVYDAALAAQLANIPSGPALQGIKVGQAVARSVLAWRRNDGSGAANKPYVLPPIPGLWQPTPPGFLPAAFVQLSEMKPFALLTTTQFLPERPPTLTSNRYTADFHEVKRVGSATSTTRTADETLLAQQFAGVVTRTNLFSLWNNVARDTARSQSLSQVETARLFVLLNVSISDALQTSHGSKFIYGLWRPVTAIQRADEDLNARTDADPDWLPLLVTPPYPSHSGNMACVGASAARALALVHGTDSISFTAVWLGNTAFPDTTTRSYDSFWQMALDEARSRVLGGIHFSFENRASQKVCVKVPEFAYANYMVPN